MCGCSCPSASEQMCTGIFPVHSDSSYTRYNWERKEQTLPINLKRKTKEGNKLITAITYQYSLLSHLKVTNQNIHSSTFLIIHRINTINRYVHFVVAFNNCVANIISSLLCANSQCTCVFVAMPSILRVNLGMYGVNSTWVCIQWGWEAIVC